MPAGMTLYLLTLASGGCGMLTFGWDAGVLGGILLTEEFQSAMGVCTLFDLRRMTILVADICL